jgi:hypothetical protein
MTIKNTTLERFRNWCNTSASTDTFTTGGVAYTRKQFEAQLLGIDVEEDTNGDMGQPQDSFDIEEY